MKKITMIMLLSLLFIFTGGVFAQEDFSNGKERTLNGHQFMPSQYILDPFVGTFYSSHLGAASALSLSRDFNDLDGNKILTLEGSVIYATLGMHFQQKIGDKWAVGLGGSALVRSGTSAMSFINDGATVNQSFDVWGRRLIYRGEKSQLTGGLTWSYSTATLFTPREFANHIIDGGSLETAPLLTSGKVWSLQGDLLWAYAFSPTFGLRASGSFGVQEKVNTSEVLLGNNRVGVIGEVDFQDKYQVPLGISLGYFRGFPSELGQAGMRGMVLGFWYTAKEDFIIGLETGALQIPEDEGAEFIDGAFGAFNIKYFF